MNQELPEAHSAHQNITGLILAGGRGSRMGGVDKGLQEHQGKPLAWHAWQRLAPQVNGVIVNANRHLEVYARWGLQVVPDANGSFDGPLAGMGAGLQVCPTPWLVTVPCDCPVFPTDLVARLWTQTQAQGAEVGMAFTQEADGSAQAQPVFCLIRRDLADSLSAFLASGQRKIDRWTGQHRCAKVLFDDAAAFFNVNTLEDLRQLQG